MIAPASNGGGGSVGEDDGEGGAEEDGSDEEVDSDPEFEDREEASGAAGGDATPAALEKALEAIDDDALVKDEYRTEIAGLQVR